jgi:hypothetical protein
MCEQDFNLHHVWAGYLKPYIADSLGPILRAEHGKGVWGCEIAEAAMPRNWHNFLQVDIKQTQLFKFVGSSSTVV